MKAYHIDRFGSVGGIVRRSSEDPQPGLKEVLMRVRASSLNYRDLMVLKGGGRGPTKIGVVPLSDGAGEVAAIGEAIVAYLGAALNRGPPPLSLGRNRFVGSYLFLTATSRS
jgi:NADPH:quinone reductase-like Zn-dependent oxidoreductase